MSQGPAHIRGLAVGALCLALFGATAGQGRSSLSATRGHLFATVARTGQVLLQQKKNGRRVTTVRAGLYSITVRDRSGRQNFHLVGVDPGVRTKTGIAFVGTVTWRLSFSPGVYRYYSDRHRSGGRTLRVVG